MLLRLLWPLRLLRHLRPISCLACLLLLAAPAHAERVAPADEPAFVQTLKQLSVKILRGSGPGTQFVGSGFTWVSRGRAMAITNYHVAALGLAEGPGPQGLHVGYAAPVNWHAATHTLAVPGADLAIIETDVVAPQDNPYTLGVAAEGDTVYSISYDQDEFQQASPVVYKGTVKAIVPLLFPSSVLLLDPPFPPDVVKAYLMQGSDCVYGASGGMVLNAKGELVAYNAGTIGNGFCVAVAIQEATRALAR